MWIDIDERYINKITRKRRGRAWRDVLANCRPSFSKLATGFRAGKFQ